MLFLSLLACLLAFLSRSALGLLDPFLPPYNELVSANDSLASSDIYALGELWNHMLADLPLLSPLFFPSGTRSSSPVLLSWVPSYASMAGENLTIQVHGSLRRAANVSASRVDLAVNDLLIGTSIGPEDGWKRDFPALNTTGYDGIARWRVRNDLLVEPVSNFTISVVWPDLCPNQDQIWVTTDRMGEFKAEVNITLSTCGSGLDSALSLGASSAALGASDCPAKIFEQPPFFFANNIQLQPTTSSDVLVVPPVGLTISSDIDDVLRVAEVWNWKQAMLWLVGRPYQPSPGMPDILKSWDDGQATQYHYTSDTFSVNGGFYIDGTHRYYPRGSWDFRPFTLDSIEAIDAFSKPFLTRSERTGNKSTPMKDLSSSRYDNLKRLLEHFPKRKFVFIGDTSTSSTTNAYPRLALEYPDQVACILIRNTRATEPADWMSSDTYHFRSLPPQKYFFYDRPEDLKIIALEHLKRLVTLESSGCFPNGMQVPMQTYKPSAIRGKSFWSAFRGIWYYLRCFRWFPRKICPFEHTHFNMTDYTEEDVRYWIGEDHEA